MPTLSNSTLAFKPCASAVEVTATLSRNAQLDWRKILWYSFNPVELIPKQIHHLELHDTDGKIIKIPDAEAHKITRSELVSHLRRRDVSLTLGGLPIANNSQLTTLLASGCKTIRAINLKPSLVDRKKYQQRKDPVHSPR
jgi:hypothetical protein